MFSQSRKEGKAAFTLIELLIVIAIIAILALIAIPNFLESQVRAKVARVHADLRSVATAIESYFVDNNVYPISIGNFCNAGGYGNGTNPPYYYHGAFECGLNGLNSLHTPINYMNNTARSMNDPFIANYGPLLTQTDYGYSNILGAVKHMTGPMGTNNWSAGAAYPPSASNFRAPAPLFFNGPNGRIYESLWTLSSVGPDRNQLDPQNNNPAGTASCYNITGNKANWNNYCLEGSTDFYDPSNGTVSRGNIWRFSCGGMDK